VLQRTSRCVVTLWRLAGLLDCRKKGMRLNTATSMPPRGYYPETEAGWLAGVPAKTMGKWVRRGYICASQKSRPPLVFSYQDIAEAIVVHELLDRGVPARQVKKAVRVLRETYGDWPLTSAKLATIRHGDPAGRASVVAELEQAMYDVGKTGVLQQVINPEHLGLVAEWLRTGGWASKLERDIRYIEVDPERLSGRPTIRGHRVAADLVARIAQTGEGKRVLRKEYRLTDAEIADALRWWRAAKDAQESATAA
jgi:uncharacterized protein (DUF433 family)